jgi:hypothetical protein
LVIDIDTKETTLLEAMAWQQRNPLPEITSRPFYYTRKQYNFCGAKIIE